MLITCNGKPVVSMRLTLPLIGVWVVELEVDSDDALTGAITIKDDANVYANVYVGTVVRSGVKLGSCYVEAVGGAGGIAKNVDARSYVGVNTRAVLADVLAQVSERLDSSSTASVLSTTLTYWTRAAGRVGLAIGNLADALGASWRVLPSGSVWFGAETWPAMPSSFEAIELDEDPAAGTVELSEAALALRPGVTLGSRRVGRVEHRVGRHEPARTTFWVAE